MSGSLDCLLLKLFDGEVSFSLPDEAYLSKEAVEVICFGDRGSSGEVDADLTGAGGARCEW
jgi:hypothetical protein